MAVKARRIQPRGLTLSQAGNSRPFARKAIFLVHFTVICPVDDAFWAKGGAREVAQIPNNVWEYWLITLNIGCGLATRPAGTWFFPPRPSAVCGPVR
jgi:hypothetical protein